MLSSILQPLPPYSAGIPVASGFRFIISRITKGGMPRLMAVWSVVARTGNTCFMRCFNCSRNSLRGGCCVCSLFIYVNQLDICKQQSCNDKSFTIQSFIVPLCQETINFIWQDRKNHLVKRNEKKKNRRRS